MKFLFLLYLFSCAQHKNIQNSGTDFHMHVHTPDGQDDVEFTGDRALLAADSIGFDRALILSNAYSEKATLAYTMQENDFVISEAKKHVARLAPACAVHPLKPWALKEVERCSLAGVKVLKLHLMAGKIDLKKNDDYQRVMSFLLSIRKYHFTILIHASYPKGTRGDEIGKLVNLINAFPDTRWLIGHAFGREFSDLSLINHDNFFAEISIVPFWCKTDKEREDFVKTVKAVGIDHFVFGSDWPVLHPAEMIKAFQKLPLTNAEQQKIISGNASKLDDIF